MFAGSRWKPGWSWVRSCCCWVRRVYSLAGWSATGFGPLNPRETLRAAIPAAAAMCLGGEVVFTSFFLSFLGLLRRLGSPSAS